VPSAPGLCQSNRVCTVSELTLDGPWPFTVNPTPPRRHLSPPGACEASSSLGITAVPVSHAPTFPRTRLLAALWWRAIAVSQRRDRAVVLGLCGHLQTQGAVGAHSGFGDLQGEPECYPPGPGWVSHNATPAHFVLSPGCWDTTVAINPSQTESGRHLAFLSEKLGVACAQRTRHLPSEATCRLVPGGRGECPLVGAGAGPAWLRPGCVRTCV
jgi:hypothetical protein